jgi:hypothetical protein
VTTGEAPSYDVPANQDPEPGSTRKSGREKHQSFLARCKRDKLMHTVLGMVLLFCGGLIVAGVIWTVTRQNRVLEDSRNFVCGKGIAGGPKCAVHLKAEKSSVESAGYVGGEVVDRGSGCAVLILARKRAKAVRSCRRGPGSRGPRRKMTPRHESVSGKQGVW